MLFHGLGRGGVRGGAAIYMFPGSVETAGNIPGAGQV